MPCRKLIVRPWKLAFPKGKQSPNHHFVGAMCMWNFGGCRFYDCNQEMHSVYTYIPYTPKITGHEWVVEENLCCTVLYRWSSRDVWYIFGQIQNITCCSLYSYLPPYLHMRFTLVDIRSIQSSALRSVPFSIIASFIQLIDKIPNHQVCIKSLWIMTYDKLLMKKNKNIYIYIPTA